jgi:hypothetical protein
MNVRLSMTVLAALGLLLTTAISQAAEPVRAVEHLKARSDRYEVEWTGIALGEGVISLRPDGHGCYDYQSVTQPIALVRWMYGAPREESRFCLDGERIVPQSFAYSIDKRPKDAFRLDFDPAKSAVKVLRRGVITVRDVPEDAYDRFSIREAIRLWAIRYAAGEAADELTLQLVNHDKTKPYRFGIKGRETVDTPAGPVETLRVDRLDNPKRPAHYWLAPSLDYVPVKIEQYKDGDLELRMLRLPPR